MPRPARPAPVLVDFESRSSANLKRRGGRLYWEDPSTEALCAVLFDTERRTWRTWRPGDAPPRLAVAVAHNAQGFDRHAAAACGWQVSEWLDSASAARRAGLPGALDALGQRWLGREKDKAGSKFTVALSRPSRARARLGQLPDVTPEVFARVQAYCRADVRILRDAWERLEPWFDVDAPAAAVDRVINDRGVCLDAELVRALQRQVQRMQDQAVRKAAKALGQSDALTRAQASSPAQFVAITGLPNAQKGTLADRKTFGALVDHPLVAVRTALASVVPGKLTAALERVSADGRLRDMFGYMAAHTGRWAGYGLQPHNLPRISFEDDAKRLGWEPDDVVAALVDGATRYEAAALTKRQVSGLLRGVLCAAPGRKLGVLDYSGIEARANAWAAGDEDALDVFRALDAGTGPDPYRVMAGRYLFGVAAEDVSKDQRGLGKIAELMLGYGAGAEKFADSCAAGGADLAALGVDAEEVVRTYREVAHPAIAQLWRDCERAFRRALETGRKHRAGRWTYEAREAADGRGGVDVWCVLPSGRPVVYSNARAKRVQRRSKRGTKFTAWALSYQGHRFREHVYGGLLVENAVQALCRDLLADALVRFEAAGLDPVGHVHDEGVCEIDADVADEGLEEMRHIMSTPPRWARGLPIKLDGFVSERYRK